MEKYFLSFFLLFLPCLPNSSRGTTTATKCKEKIKSNIGKKARMECRNRKLKNIFFVEEIYKEELVSIGSFDDKSTCLYRQQRTLNGLFNYSQCFFSSCQIILPKGIIGSLTGHFCLFLCVYKKIIHSKLFCFYNSFYVSNLHAPNYFNGQQQKRRSLLLMPVGNRVNKF